MWMSLQPFTSLRRPLWFVAVTMTLSQALPDAHAADGAVNLQISGTNVLLRVAGDKDDDWWVETSTNCADWTTHPSFGTLLSGNETNAPWRSAGPVGGGMQFFRARQTAGLYDATLLRTWSLTFTQADFSNQMALGRQYSTNAHCRELTLDNGATNKDIGARFRGNTSFTGMGGPGGTGPVKKSMALAINHSVTNADLMGYDNINLNNAYGDETIMRETLYFNIMREYAVCPAGCLAQVFINGLNWGVYSCAQQQDGKLINKWFPSNDGDRFRAGNMDGSAAFTYLGNTNVATYTPHYELKHTSVTHSLAWQRFINAIYVFNTTATNVLRDKAEDVVAVDRWLWFLVLENLFVDDDSYFNKGSDYMLYFEPETRRVHPIEHDGNEAFAATGSINYSLSPVYGATLPTRPVLYRLLNNAELRQRYLAHLRTVMEEYFNTGTMTALINGYHARSVAAIIADPKKGYTTMATYTNDLNSLKAFITNRYNYLRAHPELTPLQPHITAVFGPTNAVYATNAGWVTAAVSANGSSGVGSVWLYHRGKGYGRFTWTQMFDDGAHQDGDVGDGLYGAATTHYPAGTKVRYYIEARGTNAARAARFSPARAEEATYHYHVAHLAASETPVVFNELMADNETITADPQGEYEDWIELRNVTDQPVSLAGRYLSDEAGNARKWRFPDSTTIPANGYLIVWADEDTTASPGLHASFQLGKSGETVYLTDTDANLNQILDMVTYGPQTADVSYGRSAADPNVWTPMIPTFNDANR
jgi:spore coat protein CotH